MSPDALSTEEPLNSRSNGTEPWPLPWGWTWVPLGNLTSVVSRGRAPDYVGEGGVAVLNQKCVHWDKVDFKFAKRSSETAFRKYPDHLVVRDGDILWNSTGSGTIGRAAIYQGPEATRNGPVVADTHITLVRCEHCLPSYVHRFLSTLHVQKAIPDLNVGSTNQLELPRSAVLNLLIPVPPLVEQHRIAARINELFDEIAEGEAALVRARQGLDKWRRALLNAAVTGELTRDWREKNPPPETGSDLLARIRADRAVASKISGQTRSSNVVEPLDTKSLPELPGEWAWACLDELIDSMRNGTPTVPVKHETEYPILRISAVRPLAVDTGDIRHLDEIAALGLMEFRVGKGDLLLTRYNGSRHLVGVCGLFREARLLHYPDKIIRVRLAPAILDLAPFFEVAINAGSTRQFIDGEIKTTAGQQGISGGSLKRAPIPVPPPAEARIIIERLHEVLATDADNHRSLTEARMLSSAQRQSILKAAFEGRLVPQDPADESAAALLARLRGVNGAIKASSRRPGRPRENAQGTLAL